MEIGNRQFIQLGSRNRSTSKLRNSNHFDSLNSSTYQRPFVPIQNNIDSRLIKTGFKNDTSMKDTFIQKRVFQMNSQLHKPPTNFILQDKGVQLQVNERPLKYDQNYQISRFQSSKQMNQGLRILSRERSPSDKPQSKSKIVQLEKSNTMSRFRTAENQIITEEIREVSAGLQLKLVQKIQFLQQILNQKDKQKNRIQTALTEQNRKLREQNIKLKQDTKHFEETKQRIIELEQMLQREISKSLELMDVSQILHNQNVDLTTDLLVKDTLLNTLQQELKNVCSQANLRRQEMDKHSRETQERIRNFMAQAQIMKSRNQLIVKQMNQRMKKLQTEVVSLHSSVHKKQIEIIDLSTNHQLQLQKLQESKQLQIAELNQTIYDYKQKFESTLNQSKLSRTHSKNFSFGQQAEMVEQKNQCKKCKQLLKTVFKLNSYLNKK